MKKILIVSAVGQILEFYDIALMTFLLPKISYIFFPSTDDAVLILASLGTFLVGFASRPLGGIIFGHIGDKIGRKSSLSLSMFSMGIITVLIGTLEGYDTMGFLSPILMLLLRFAQGLCLGGEYNGSMIFFMEHYNGRYPGFFSSLISSAAFVGVLLASMVVLLCSRVFREDLAWRIPFFMGGIIAIIAYIIRKTITETPIFLKNQYEEKIIKTPIIKIFQSYYKSIIITMFIGWNMGSISLTILGYMVTHLNKFIGISFEQSIFVNQITILTYLIIIPISGFLADKIGPKKIMLITIFLIIVFSVPAYYFMSLKYLSTVIIGCIMLAILAGLFLGPIHLFIYSLFPSSVRYSGLCFSFSIGVTVLGGVAPLISGILVIKTQNLIAPALYLIISAIFGLIGLSLNKDNLDLSTKNT